MLTKGRYLFEMYLKGNLDEQIRETKSNSETSQMAAQMTFKSRLRPKLPKFEGFLSSISLIILHVLRAAVAIRIMKYENQILRSVAIQM
jgi:hypothetical protein